ncbi:MAG: thioredoxin [Gemmatimonadota bacterium]
MTDTSASSPAAAGARPVTVRCPSCSTLNRVDLGRIASGPTCAKCKNPLHLDHPVKASDSDLGETIRSSSVPVLVDFYADWCGPCRMTAPFLEQLVSRHAGHLLVLKVDTDQNSQKAGEYGIRGIPTLIAFGQGKELRRHVGAADLATLESLIRL